MASSTDDCSRKISGEHYISKAVLEQRAQGGTVKIYGLPWRPKDTAWIVPIPRLEANILCKRHNEALSPLDSEAGRFFAVLDSFDQGFNVSQPSNEVSVFSGHDIELWMLKTLCGMLAAGAVATGGEAHSRDVPSAWIDILFRGAPMPPGWGLYAPVTQDSLYHSQSFEFLPRSHPVTGVPLAADLVVNGHRFHLLLGRPDVPEAWGIHRPRTLAFSQGMTNKYLELSWEDPALNVRITYTRLGTYDGPSPQWPVWAQR